MAMDPTPDGVPAIPSRPPLTGRQRIWIILVVLSVAVFAIALTGLIGPWAPAFDATDAGLDIWRPAITVDGKGLVHLAWAQQVDGNWDIYHRTYNPAVKSEPFSKITRLTTHQGADFNVVAGTDSRGDVWLAWQSRQPSGRNEIHATRINAEGGAVTLTDSRMKAGSMAIPNPGPLGTLTMPFSHFSEDVSLLTGISVSPLNSVNGTGLGIHDEKIAASR